MYTEENGTVVLTISRDDYANLLVALGIALSGAASQPELRQPLLRLINRLNEGNPHFTPYKLEDAPSG